MDNENASPPFDPPTTKIKFHVFAKSLAVFAIACLILDVYSKSNQLKQLIDAKEQAESNYESGQRLFDRRQKLFDSVLKYDEHEMGISSAIYPQVFDRLRQRTSPQMSLLKFEGMYHWRSEGIFGANKIDLNYSVPQASVPIIKVEVIHRTGTTSRSVGTLDFFTGHFVTHADIVRLMKTKKPVNGEIQIRWFNENGNFVIECSQFDSFKKQYLRRHIILDKPRNQFGNQVTAFHRDSFILLPDHASTEKTVSQNIFYRTDPDSGQHEVIEIAIQMAPHDAPVLERSGFELIQRIHSREWEDEDLEQKFDFGNAKGCQVPLRAKAIVEILNKTW